jgi:hypothetical protein
LGDEVESFLGSLDVRSNATLVTDIASRLTVLLLGKRLQLLVDLGTPSKSFSE